MRPPRERADRELAVARARAEALTAVAQIYAVFTAFPFNRGQRIRFEERTHEIINQIRTYEEPSDD